ncbi:MULTISPECIES: UDP-glucose 4-epimerase GalE [Micrococcus]|uniref:UDP-glucose 4-epimerase GalE n=1 Tax=Micrococcus TaxID=1269 RepID=UPI00077DF179|nr:MULTISPECIES: UDP-glucose 4-epimerase GalE [Micrococcus]KYK02189.1 UDP-glucose 4-epimerase [Micrococcus sp. CH3]KYK09347.1 UDP-glucose 4-epimerase [Micrococcus sp. CH7]NME16086.1 UDP-glucose 4-epimerase GalE [Micrococcus luteus]
MTWLITGGAGYIGGHVAYAFRAAGIPAVVVDDLSTGRARFVPSDVPLVRENILDTPALSAIMRGYDVSGVVHVAGFKYAGVSMREPLHTYRTNVQGTLSVLEAMRESGVDALVFSSSAAVYGTPAVEIVTEKTPTAPESPYGESKLIGEWMIAAQGSATGLRHTSLRYFNVVGSGPCAISDLSPHNLFPLVFAAIERGVSPHIFGTDYPTPDGTCVRDYVHVQDVAASHVSAALALGREAELAPVYNLGSGEGTSVRQIVEAVSRVTGRDISPKVEARRKGDPARIVADGSLAARDINWRNRHSLDEMVRTAWAARRAG